jgi:hypothetical protein
MRRSFTYEGQRYFVVCNDDADFEVKKALLVRDLDEGRVRITKNTLVTKELSNLYTKRKEISTEEETA